MRLLCQKALVSLYLTLLACVPVLGQQILLLPEKPTQQIGNRVTFLRDSLGSLTIEQIINDSVFRFFSESRAAVPNFGITQDAVWVKFEALSLTSSVWFLEVANPMLSEIDYFEVKNGIVASHKKAGFLVPFSSRQVQFRNPIFTMFLAEGESTTVYLKIKSNTTLSLPLRIGSDVAIINTLHRSDMFFTVGFGAVLVMLLYNLLIFISSQDKIHLLYCLYLSASILLNGHVLGVNFEVLWPSWPSINYYGIVLFPGLVALTILPFSLQFLELKNYFPNAFRWFYGLWIIPIAAAVYIFYGQSQQAILLSQAGAIIYMVYLTGTAFLVYRRGFMPARAYLIAFITFFVSILIFITKINSSFIFHELTNASLQIGTIAQMALLSIALADRINLYKKQNEAAKREKELFIIEQNRLLEAKVSERTHQLESINAELLDSQQILLENAELLQRINNSLEQTQKQLLEKDARLAESQLLAMITSYELNTVTKDFFYSESIYEVLGLNPTKPINPAVLESLIHQEDYLLVRHEWEKAIENHDDFNLVYRMLTPTGQTIWVQEFGYPDFDEQGNLTKIVGTIQNITERKRSEEQIAEAYRLLKIQNENITDSIRYAKRIQSAIMPEEEDLTEVFGDAFVLFMPRDIVSGDFYWFSRHKTDAESKLFLAVVDCTGHGVPGALMSIISHNLLRETIEIRKIHEPAAILADLREGIRTALKQDENENRDGLDVALCVLNLKSKTLTFAGTYTPLYYFLPDNTEIQTIKPCKLSIGGSTTLEHKPFEQVSIPLVDSMMFYLFSDGYQDQFGGPEGKKFMAKSFRELLTAIHLMPVKEQKTQLEERITKWMADSSQKQIDDIMVLGVRVDLKKISAI